MNKAVNEMSYTKFVGESLPKFEGLDRDLKKEINLVQQTASATLFHHQSFDWKSSANLFCMLLSTEKLLRLWFVNYFVRVTIIDHRLKLKIPGRYLSDLFTTLGSEDCLTKFLLFVSLFCSCCGAYQNDGNDRMGICSLEEFAARKACGDLLDKAVKMNYAQNWLSTFLKIRTVVMILTGLLQAVATSLSVWIFIKMR